MFSIRLLARGSPAADLRAVRQMARRASPKTPREATLLVTSVLSQAISEHETGRASEIGADFDDVQLELLPIPPEDKITAQLALNFWESWGDAARHDWRYYEGMGKDDWPRLARVVMAALEGGTRVSDPLLLKHFAPRPSLVERLKAWIRRPEEPSV